MTSNIDDFIVKVRKNGKKVRHFRSFCPICSKDKGYVVKVELGKMCQVCSGRKVGKTRVGLSPINKGIKITDPTLLALAATGRKGKIPWNKGKKEERPEVLEKFRQVQLGRVPPNKGTSMPEEQKIRLSCVNRGIKVEEFDKFTTPENHHERSKFSGLGLHAQCFERDNYTCDICFSHGDRLNAHHMNGWNHFPEERFNIDNLVTLCKSCHKEFHRKFGNGKSTFPNTKEQYEIFKSEFKGTDDNT